MLVTIKDKNTQIYHSAITACKSNDSRYIRNEETLKGI